MNHFYRSKSDVSLFVDVTAAVKIVNADAKPTDHIADESLSKISDLRSTYISTDKC